MKRDAAQRLGGAVVKVDGVHFEHGLPPLAEP
jgi:hypothetical protein